MNEHEALDSTNPIGLDEINLRKEKLAEIDASIEDIKSKIEFAEAIRRLQSNPDYIRVVEEGYLVGEGERISKCLLEPTYLKRDQIENMMEMMAAIRIFKTYIMFKEGDASNGQEQIEELIDFRTSVNATA
jgi:hypothetical protein